MSAVDVKQINQFGEKGAKNKERDAADPTRQVESEEHADWISVGLG